PTTVYVIQGNQKRWVPSSAVLDTWSDFSDVVAIPNEEASAYLDGPQAGARPGRLISAGGAVFLITNDGSDPYRRQKRHVISPSVLSQCFPNSVIAPIPAGDANLHTNGPEITGCVPTHPSGSVVSVLNDAVYFVNSDQPNQR